MRRISTSVITITIKNRWSTNIKWIMGGRRASPRHRPTSPNAINYFSDIEQGWVFEIFRLNYMSCTITPTIYSLGGIVAGLGPISNSPITTNIITWKIHQSTTFTLVMGGIVACLRPIPTSTCIITLVPRLLEEEWLVSCYLDPPLSTYPS